MKYSEILPIAERLVDLFAPVCKRIEIAGSIRRMKEEPGDIEICAIPDLRPPKPIFGQKRLFSTPLDQLLAICEESNCSGICVHKMMNGPKYKKLAISLDENGTWPIKCDLFLCTPPADWGLEYLIRTGPKEFSAWVVSNRFIGGALPNGYYVDHLAVWQEGTNEYIPMPEEIDFLRFCKLGWIEPKNRRPIWQHSVRKLQVKQSA